MASCTEFCCRCCRWRLPLLISDTRTKWLWVTKGNAGRTVVRPYLGLKLVYYGKITFDIGQLRRIWLRMKFAINLGLSYNNLDSITAHHITHWAQMWDKLDLVTGHKYICRKSIFIRISVLNRNDVIVQFIVFLKGRSLPYRNTDSLINIVMWNV